ncbi:MAG TPA: class I SAM-dependent methyltransferase [Opitutaceae bacterium]|nr:class I SAM-dependent methyltransferase [Opitutaceae bacterium]
MSTKFYGEDLAFLHDAGFTGFAAKAAPYILKRLRRRCEPGARVVEIGCGSGALTQHLTGAGYDVLAVDLSPAMIRLGRAKAPGAKFRVASWYDFAPPPCDAIVAVGECFNYMRAGTSAHTRAVDAFLRRAGAALRAGGLLLFDFLEPNAHRPRHRTVRRSGAGWAILVEIAEERRIITRRISSIRFQVRRPRVSGEIHRQLRLSRRQLGRALQAAGFVVTFQGRYGRMRLAAGQVVAEAIRMFG